MPTLILTPRQTADSRALWKAAASKGWQVERLVSWRVPEQFSVRDPILYCEALFGPSLAAQLGLEMLCPAEDWLVRLPFEYKSRHIVLSTLGQARLNSSPLFVKPPNDKSFPAAIYRGSELPLGYADDMPVLVSDVVKWEREFRCFVLNRSLQTYSIYSRFGELQDEQGFVSAPAEDDALKAFLDKLLADPRVELPHATVIDVGVIEGGGWACVELNAAWGSGIYGCEPAVVLEVIRHACRPIQMEDSEV